MWLPVVSHLLQCRYREMWLSVIPDLLQCRYREMGAQVEARLRSFTSRREFVEKTSYDDVSCSFACLATRVPRNLLELRDRVHSSAPGVKPDCVQALAVAAMDTGGQACECPRSSLQVLLLDTVQMCPDKRPDVGLQMYLDVTDVCGHRSSWAPPSEAPPTIRVEEGRWDDVAAELRSGVQVGEQVMLLLL